MLAGSLDASPHLTYFPLPLSLCGSTPPPSLPPCTHRRVVSDVVRSVDARRELLLPVEFTATQAQHYQAVLARRLDLLSTPAPSAAAAAAGAVTSPRSPSASHPQYRRVAQLRAVCGDLRRVCTHPYLLPELEPEQQQQQLGAAASVDLHREHLRALGASEAGVVASGKLQLLGRLLACLAEQGKTTLLLSHTSKVWGVFSLSDPMPLSPIPSASAWGRCNCQRSLNV